MAKTRLRNSDRDAICAAVLSHKFAPIDTTLKVEEIALAVEVRSQAYAGHLATMDKLPDGALPLKSYCKVNAGGRSIRLDFSADGRTSMRMFQKHEYSPVLNIAADDALSIKVVEWAERVETAKAERRHLKSVTDGTLAAFHTFDDLLTAWPEAEPFIKAVWQTRPEYSANVPAVQLKDLSSALDLPPETPELAQAA